MSMVASRPVSLRVRKVVWTLLGLVAATALVALASPAIAGAQTLSSNKGELDCNGNSPIQQSIHTSAACADIRGFDNEDNSNTWGGRFYDNGTYIGHDEPDMAFLSRQPGSGNDVTWTETLSARPVGSADRREPRSRRRSLVRAVDRAVALDGVVRPQLLPGGSVHAGKRRQRSRSVLESGEPVRDGYQGGGSAFMEMQFYPPGFSPFANAISCDNTHWCAALTIDSLECTDGVHNLQCQL